MDGNSVNTVELVDPNYVRFIYIYLFNCEMANEPLLEKV